MARTAFQERTESQVTPDAHHQLATPLQFHHAGLVPPALPVLRDLKESLARLAAPETPDERAMAEAPDHPVPLDPPEPTETEDPQDPVASPVSPLSLPPHSPETPDNKETQDPKDLPAHQARTPTTDSPAPPVPVDPPEGTETPDPTDREETRAQLDPLAQLESVVFAPNIALWMAVCSSRMALG